MPEVCRILKIDDLKRTRREHSEEVLQYLDGLALEIYKHLEQRTQEQVQESYLEVISSTHEELLERVEKHHQEPSTYDIEGRLIRALHPSGLKGCPLKQFYGLKGEPKTTEVKRPYNNVLYVESGKYLHLMVQQFLLEMFPDFLLELPIAGQRAEELRMGGGHTDGVIIHTLTSGVMFRALVEIKTMGSKQFQALSGLGQTYMAQVQCYEWCTDCPFAVLIYVRREDCEIATYGHRFNEVEFGEVRTRALRIIEAYKKDEQPQPRPENEYFECRECGYQAKCPRRSVKERRTPEEILNRPGRLARTGMSKRGAS